MTFEEGLYQTLQRKKYDDIMGRSVDWAAKIMEWIAKWMEWLLNRLDIPMPQNPDYNAGFVTNMVTVVAIGAALLLLTLFILYIKKRKRTPKITDDMVEILQDAATSAESLLQTGQNFSSQGDIRQGVRYVYLAVLWSLQKQNCILVHRAMTNQELKQAVAKSAPAFSPLFDEAADGFTFIWFGHKPMSPEAFSAYYQKMAQLSRDILNGGGVPREK